MSILTLAINLAEHYSIQHMKEKTKKEKNIGMAVVAYIIFFIPLLTDAKDDPFVKYHVHQGFVLFIASIAVSIISFIFPFLFMLTIIGQIGIMVLAIIGIANAINGEEKELPLIGHFAEKVSF